VAQDPLIAVAPLLFSIAITLLIGRVLPWLAGAGLRLFARVSSPAVHIALWSVARAPRQPMRLVQLCTLTLTFGIFAATVAGIETRNAADQQAYEAGATVRLVEFPDRAHGSGRILPLADYRALPGVRAVMPALRFESTGDITNATSDGTNVDVLGIDPAAAGRVIWFRPDFADLPLGRLLAPLAAPGPNAIVSDTFLRATGLHRGDTFQVVLTTGQSISIRVAGTAHYFPTLDPRAYPFVVTNLAYLEQASHAGAANEVWLAADPHRDVVDRLIRATHAWLRPLIDYQGIAPTSDAGADPLKVGIYGVVSVGFLIAVALALLGFIAYSYLSMQQRLTEFAVLRALGLSEGGLRALLFYEQVFLLGAAILGGIAAGVLTTQLYLPYLPIATRSLPPFLVVTPWISVAAFVLALLVLFLLVLSVHVLLVLRLPLGRVLRLGDA
jgi:putative ABC transport system permease protein